MLLQMAHRVINEMSRQEIFMKPRPADTKFRRNFTKVFGISRKCRFISRNFALNGVECHMYCHS
jgi:hypothetical protein